MVPSDIINRSKSIDFTTKCFRQCLFDGFTIDINTLKSELSTAKTYELISTDEKPVANKHCNHSIIKFAVGITESQERLPTLYWLPKLHKRPYKARFIANSSSCTTTSLSKVFQALTISTYVFSTLYTTLPHNLIKNQLVDLIENTCTCRREEVLYVACNEERDFFASKEHKKYNLWTCQKVTESLIYLLDNTYIRFGSKLYRQNIGIPMGTNCAPPPFLLIYFYFAMMKSLTKEKRYDMIDAFNSTSRYLDDLLNIDTIHFEQMVPAEFQLNNANASDTGAAFLVLNLSIHNDTVSTKIYDKRDDFDFDIVNFPFLDGDVPRRPSYGVYILNDTSNVTDSLFLLYLKNGQSNKFGIFTIESGFNDTSTKVNLVKNDSQAFSVLVRN